MTSDSETDYGEIARQAYSNGEELYREAGLLYAKHSPRAFTLAVASIEELIKAELADMVSKGSAKPSDLVAEVDGQWRPILTRHESKQRLLTLFLLLRAAKKEGGEAKELEVDRILKETYDTGSVQVQGQEQIIELISKMETRRKDSVYVGVKGRKGEIKTPQNQISEKMCAELLDIIGDLLKSVEANLMVSKERYAAEARKLNEERKMRPQPLNKGTSQKT